MAAGDKKAALSGLTGSAELRSRLLFVLFAMLIVRIGSHITIPGVDPRVMAQLFAQQSDGILCQNIVQWRQFSFANLVGC